MGIPHREFRCRPGKYRGQRISMDFKDADLTNVFRIIAEVSNLNIITSDDVKGEGLPPAGQRSVGSGARHRPPLEGTGRRGRKGTSSASRRFPPSGKEEQDRFDAQKQVEQSRQEALNRAAEVKTTQEAVFDTIPVSYSKASELLVKIKPLGSKFGRLDSDDRTNVLIIRDLPKQDRRDEGPRRQCSTRRRRRS